jgi:transketolase
MTEKLKISARNVRCNIIKMISKAGSGHPGGALSATDLMVTLYMNCLKHNPKNPYWIDRDRVIFSKGHCSALLYSCLSEAGYFPEEELNTFRKLGSRLQGHPSLDKGLPGVEISSGSLGHGLSIGIGMALALKHQKKNSRVYVLIGDGECDCGQIWEAALSAGHYKLDNLCVILDYNKLQIDGSIEDVMGLEPLAEKWKDFRWNVIKIDGHNFDEILNAYQEAEKTKNMPTVIIAETIKGKGVSYMENQASWHGKAPNKEQEQLALEELTSL